MKRHFGLFALALTACGGSATTDGGFADSGPGTLDSGLDAAIASDAPSCVESDCAAGSVCDPVSGVCVEGCRASSDCGAFATCAAGSCACVAGARDCGAGCVSCPTGPAVATTACDEGVCVASNCASGFSPCAAGCCAPPVPALSRIGEAAWNQTAIALDSAQRPHIAFIRGAIEIHLASWTGLSWTTELVTTGASVSGLSLAIDSLDRPVVAFSQASDGSLAVARRAGEVWTIDDTAGASCRNPALRLDAADRAHVACSRTSLPWTGLDHVFEGDAGWSIEPIDDDAGTGRGAALWLDGSAVHTTYFDYDSGDVYYARRTATGWIRTLVDNASAGQTSLRLDADGTVHISYPDMDRARYGRGAPGSFVSEDVSPVATEFFVFGAVTSIDLRNGEPNIAYSDYDSGALILARRTAGAWSRTVVDPGDGVGAPQDTGHSAIVVGADGVTHISYVYFVESPRAMTLSYARVE